MHSMRMKRRSLALMFVPIAIGMGGCTSSGGKSPTATSGVPTRTSTASPIPTNPPTTDDLFPHKLMVPLANKSGYSFDMTIALGKPVRIPTSETLTHPLDNNLALDSACTVDPHFDIAIAAYWSAEATTVGFDTPISMRAGFASGGPAFRRREYYGRGVAPYEGDNRIRVARHFSDGPSCNALSSEGSNSSPTGNAFSVKWDKPIPEGSIRRDEFFIIVKNYFTPATPKGDSALLDWIVLQQLPGGNFDDNAMLYLELLPDGTLLYGGEKGITLSGKRIGG